MVGGWQQIKNQSEERMAPGGGGLRVKLTGTSNMGYRFTVVIAFLFLCVFFVVFFCFAFVLPDTIATCLFVV